MDAPTPITGSDPLRESLCGRTLGDYRIERRVGGGATSDVFLAKQLSLGRSVALKILKDELSNDEIYVKRFLQEARSAARLEHPNIVRIYEVGELTDLGEGKRIRLRRRERPKTYRFIAQEYVAGMSLLQYLRRHKTTSILQTFALLEQIAAALKCASDQNIVHRDVKPENVLIDASGVMKVVDFGLARFTDSTEETLVATSLTRAGIAMGTPLYMSPEQARGQKVDSRSDIYSLGVTAYRALTGSAPFYGETHLAVVLKHLNERPRPIDEIRPDVPKRLCDLVMKMLEKDPSARPESMGAILAEVGEMRREYLMREGECGSTLEFNEGRFDSDERDDTRLSTVSARMGFLQTDCERELFQHTLHTATLSREWQASVAQLDKKRSVERRFCSRKRFAAGIAVLCASFLLGGGLLLIKNGVVATRAAEPPLTIQRQKTVEEQYVVALQLGTVDAWKSVIEYFPGEENWNIRALRQLALAYVFEDNVDEAEKVFEQLATKSTQPLGVDRYVVVGTAWVAASRGDYDRATSALSDLDPVSPLDGLSEAVLVKTQELYRSHYGEGSALLNIFERLSPAVSRLGERQFNARPEGFGGVRGGGETLRDRRGGNSRANGAPSDGRNGENSSKGSRGWTR